MTDSKDAVKTQVSAKPAVEVYIVVKPVREDVSQSLSNVWKIPRANLRIERKSVYDGVNEKADTTISASGKAEACIVDELRAFIEGAQ